MYVLCMNCMNHYDDTIQSSKCKGISRSADKLAGGGDTSHASLGIPKPVETHVWAVREIASRAPHPNALPDGVTPIRSRPHMGQKPG